MSEEMDKLQEAVQQAVALLVAERADTLLVVAVKGSSLYRMSNLDGEDFENLFRVAINAEKSDTAHLREMQVYKMEDGKLQKLGGTGDELN